MKQPVLPTLLYVCMAACAIAGSLPPATEIEEAMRRANDYKIANNSLGNNDWVQGAYQTGNFMVAETLDDNTYRSHALAWAEANAWQVSDPDPRHADAHAAGQTFLDLYLLDPQPIRKASILQALQDVVNNVSWSDGRSDTIDNQGDDDWYWIDAFFMAAPAFARLANIENDEIYRTQLRAMYHWMKNTRGLYDNSEGLWYRDNRYISQSTANGEKVFWARGNGWLIAGLARVLDQLPAAHPDRAEYESIFQSMAAALLPIQGTDGFWRSSLLDPAEFPNPETSGTAFFTYAIAWGINTGLLDRTTFEPTVIKSWNGMAQTALQPDGLLGYVQAVAAEPGPALPDDTRPYAVGAFLLAGCEMLELAGGLAPLSADAGDDETRLDLENKYEVLFPLDGSGTILRSGTATSYSWWLGDVFLASGMQTSVALPRGDHRLTLRVEHSSGAVSTQSVMKTLLSADGPIEVSAVIASGDDGNAPANTLDDNLGTRWSSYGDGEWIQFDLGVTHPLTGIELAFFFGDQRFATFDVGLSNNAQTWTPVLTQSTSSGTTLDLETYLFPESNARYLRITGHGNSSNPWNSITEVGFLKNGNPQEPEFDSDNDGLPDAWEIARFDHLTESSSADTDHDGLSNEDEFRLGSDPQDASDASSLRIQPGAAGSLSLAFTARAAFGPGYAGMTRYHRIACSDSLTSESWLPLPGSERIPGKNLPVQIQLDPPHDERMFYRMECLLEPTP